MATLIRGMFLMVCVFMAANVAVSQPLERQMDQQDGSYCGLNFTGDWLASSSASGVRVGNATTMRNEGVEAMPTVALSKPVGEIFTLPYGAGEMEVTLEAPSFSPADGAFVLENDLVNPLTVGNHSITWTLKDDHGNTLAVTTQSVKVELPECKSAVTFDGYSYPVVRVGYDCWLKENLKASTGIDGAVAYMGKAANRDKFGLLYTWQAAVAGPSSTSYIQGICPDGWGIPTVEELQSLYANANNDIDCLKDTDPSTWTAGKCGKTPSTGFDLLGAGYYESELSCFEDLLNNTLLWTSAAGVTKGTAICCEFNDYSRTPMFKEVPVSDKVSVRCIKKNS